MEQSNPRRIDKWLKWRPNFKLIRDKVRTWLKWRPDYKLIRDKVRVWLMWRPSFKLSRNMALITGITMGVLAAVVQGYFGVQPPAGAGICAVSHPADLVGWVLNKMAGIGLFSWVFDRVSETNFVTHEMFVTVPVMTSVGFILGSFVAALRNKEFKFRKGPVRDNMLAFILGFVIINFGMLWGSCPIRTAILASYGMWFAVLILGMMVMGVIVACLYIKWKVRRVH